VTFALPMIKSARNAPDKTVMGVMKRLGIAGKPKANE
jgi:hypothetical protein